MMSRGNDVSALGLPQTEAWVGYLPDGTPVLIRRYGHDDHHVTVTLRDHDRWGIETPLHHEPVGSESRW